MKNQTRKHLTIAIVVAGVIGLGTLATSFRVSSSARDDRAFWMEHLDDARSLSSLTIPGSHDSGALYSVGDLAGKCQDLSISEQLQAGIRYLDVRLQASNEGLYVVHGFVNEGQSFKTLLSSVTSFLSNHYSETVLLSVKEEASPRFSMESFDDLLKGYVADKDFRSLFYTGRTLPKTLGDARQKMVLLSRYSGNSIGVDCYGDNQWADPSDATSSNTFDLTLGEKIHVQDHYKLKDAETKWNEANTALAYAVAHPEVLTLNFYTGYLVGSFPPSYAPSVAKTINARIVKELPAERNGVIIMDFVTNDLVASVLEGTL
jgi:1-phosphatidylinositol phosphodiesterase